AELAAVFERGIGLGVPRLVLGRAAAHPEDDDRVLARGDLCGRRGGSRFQAQQARERETGGGQETRLEGAAPAQSQAAAEVRAADQISSSRLHARVVVQ